MTRVYLEGWGQGEGLGEGQGSGGAEWKSGVCSSCDFSPKCKYLLGIIWWERVRGLYCILPHINEM